MCTAISLEWDKQPHYLEASLMMKGYSAEEARAAAQRVQAYPAPAAARPPLLATAYANTRDKVIILILSPHSLSTLSLHSLSPLTLSTHSLHSLLSHS